MFFACRYPQYAKFSNQWHLHGIKSFFLASLTWPSSWVAPALNGKTIFQHFLGETFGVGKNKAIDGKHLGENKPNTLLWS